jgi:hypothetical protein
LDHTAWMDSPVSDVDATEVKQLRTRIGLFAKNQGRSGFDNEFPPEAREVI